MAESRRMSKSELFTHFAERFGIRRAEAGEFFDELQQLTEQELLRCGEFVLPGVAKLVVQQRERRMGRNPVTRARLEIPAKQVVKARIAKLHHEVAGLSAERALGIAGALHRPVPSAWASCRRPRRTYTRSPSHRNSFIGHLGNRGRGGGTTESVKLAIPPPATALMRNGHE